MTPPRDGNRDLQTDEVMRIRADLGETSPEQIASVKQHIDEHAKDAADRAALNKTIFGGQ